MSQNLHFETSKDESFSLSLNEERKNKLEDEIQNAYYKKNNQYIYMYELLPSFNLKISIISILIFNLCYIISSILNSRINDLSHMYDGITEILFKGFEMNIIYVNLIINLNYKELWKKKLEMTDFY